MFGSYCFLAVCDFVLCCSQSSEGYCELRQWLGAWKRVRSDPISSRREDEDIRFAIEANAPFVRRGRLQATVVGRGKKFPIINVQIPEWRSIGATRKTECGRPSQIKWQED
jgi:hypothetical protein